MAVSVIIVTLNRPECVERCLSCLRRQSPKPDQVILIDASADDRTEAVSRQFPEVEYLRTDVGYGHMTKSRNLGLSRATGEIIAFIDDDAFAHEGWLPALLEPYADPKVGGVGGRALNNQPDEAKTGVDRIGRLEPNGALTGFFAADPGKLIEVDHIIGCNMSWRRSILEQLGGLRDDYPGTEVREETDIALRVRRLGYRLVFQPTAVVTHIGAPQVKGRRFDARYAYFHSHNHAILMMRNFGLQAITWRSGARELTQATGECLRRVAVAMVHLAARLGGFVIGTLVGCVRLARERGSPVRRGGRDDARITFAATQESSV